MADLVASPLAAVPLSSGKRRSHIEISIILYVFIATVIAVGAINSQNNLLFAAFGLAIGVVVVSGLVSGPALMSLDVARVRPSEASPGEPTTVIYKLHNRSRFLPAFAVQVTERGFALKDATCDQTLANKRWRRPVGFFSHVGPGQTVEARVVVWPAHRGEYELVGVRLMTRFPFGILRKSIDVDLPGKIVVFPLVLRLRDEVKHQLGLHRTRTATTSNSPGGTDEFFGVREYRAGDPLRTIAWKASARANQLRIIQRSRSTSDRVTILVDLSGIHPVTDRASAEQAICLAASIAADRIGTASAVALRVPSFGIFLRSGSGPGQFQRILRSLALIDIGSVRAATDALENRADKDPVVRVCARANNGSSLQELVLDAQTSFSALLDRKDVPEALLETVRLNRAGSRTIA